MRSAIHIRRGDLLNPFDSASGLRSLLFLAPHSDDAAFSSDGLLREWVAAGLVGHIITVFSRSRYSNNDTSLSPHHVTRVRKAEDCRYRALLGKRMRVSWLDFADAPLRPEYDDGVVCTRGRLTHRDFDLAHTLAALVRPHLAQGAVLAAPLAVGAHVDHRITRAAAIQVLVGWRGPAIFYEDLPYAAALKMRQLRTAASRAQECVRRAFAPVVLASTSLLDAKLDALSCYASQINAGTVASVCAHALRLGSPEAPGERFWYSPGVTRKASCA